MMPTQQSCDCLCGVNRLAERLLAVLSSICVPFCVKIRKESWWCEGKSVFLQKVIR